ncbi:MAG: DUF1624 domain-containing protein [Oscillospiraceae bacterium]|jgi:uncharacterized membrane protein|nr:DUF1624 domain-containing protein [Oscillospiraceae bacterium]
MSEQSIPEETGAPRRRIEAIDALRGFAVALMVIHHAFYDAVEFLGAPGWLYSNPVFDVLHYIFAGLFIFLAGVSSRFSRSNFKRGMLTALAALAVSIATTLIESPVRFGVLHLLASCMLLYALFGKYLERAVDGRGSLPENPIGGSRRRIVFAVVCVALIILSALAVKYISPGVTWLWSLGWLYPGFFSSDYFPLFPWIFVFLLGTLAGEPIKAGRLPARFYSIAPPFFPVLGRRALIIYLLHQPVLYGLTLLTLRIRG